jgi:predicted alpha/beta-fold hydrolase
MRFENPKMTANSAQPNDLPARQWADSRDTFSPSWLLRNGHVQTLAGTYVFGRWPKPLPPTEIQQLGEVEVDQEDRLVFHDERPDDWQPDHPMVLLLHGLAGSHDSPYMNRIAHQLRIRGARTIRLDWRGSGAGMALARYPYHSGRSEDLRATVNLLSSQFPQSPLSVVGFSMGGTVLLKLLGEQATLLNGGRPQIIRAAAVCPPVDLAFTVRKLQCGLASWYDRYFTRCCIRDVQTRKTLRPDAIVPEDWFNRPPRTLQEFDDTFTAPVCGFASGDDYYAKSSSLQFLPVISTPTLIIASQDDPVVPIGPLQKADCSPSIQVRLPRSGGHMGFVTSAGLGWLDQQVASWALDGV